jgi:hypothetical protein
MLRSIVAALSIALALPFSEATWNVPKPGTIPPPRKWNGNLYSCKCYFDDACWPKKPEWDRLNKTVNGNLRLHVPPEAVCHNKFNGPLGTLSTYNEAACNELQATYADEQWR